MSTNSFIPPKRLLMGPGPSDAPPSVLNAMSQPLIGHLDPSFVQMMEEIKDMLRQVFLTENDMTFPISGTGSAGMEFCFVNLIEPGTEFEAYRTQTNCRFSKVVTLSDVRTRIYMDANVISQCCK